MLLVYSLIKWPSGEYQWWNEFSGEWTTLYRTWNPLYIIDAFENLSIIAIIILIVGNTLAVIISQFKSELTITDKRVYGIGIFGKRVDLPLDSISSIGSLHFFKGILISTSSGNIKFFGIKNFLDIHKIISELLIKRQESPTYKVTTTYAQSDTVSHELKNYKDLLDSEIITQEEFDTKKKELLGL